MRYFKRSLLLVGYINYFISSASEYHNIHILTVRIAEIIHLTATTMAWTVYILSICSLLGGSLCVSDEAFRMLNQKVDLLQASLRIGFRDLETSYSTDLQDVMIEVKELEAKLYKLEELLHTIGNVTEIGMFNCITASNVSYMYTCVLSVQFI